MDSSRFTESKTGELVRITTPDGPDWAFVPEPLPPAWDFPSRLWPLLSKAQVCLARLDEKGINMGNPRLLMTPLQKREALRSSSLEGTYATPQDLLLFELDPTGPSSKNDASNWREVSNYARSLKYGFRMLTDESPKGLPLSLRLIKNMHDLLLGSVQGNAKNAGEFRKRQVHVGSDRRYVPPPPGERLDACLHALETYLHESGTKYDPLVLAYLVHYQFEAIHPFMDGNGRVGRAFLSLSMSQWCKLKMPWLYMSAYFERYKDEYVDNMFRISTHGDWERWIEFCLRGTVIQCRDAMRRCDELIGIRQDMFSKVGDLPRMHSITEQLFFSPIFRVSDVMEWTRSSRPTAKTDIDVLIDKGLVQYLAGKRPRIYFAPAIFNAAYREDSDRVDEPDKPAKPILARSDDASEE